MSLRFAVVHEAEADFEIATVLADRELREAIDWLDEYLILDQRTWIDRANNGERLLWSRIPRLAREAGISVWGRFDVGEPGFPDAAAARRAIWFLRNEFPDLDAVVLNRDQDDQPDRRRGLEQARNDDDGNVVIVVGLAIAKRECWVICGFDTRNDDETERLEQERQRLGFNPILQSHELTACSDDGARRNSKRVLRALSGDDHARERCCWEETAPATLRERGSDNGLASYLDEVRMRLGGLIGHAT